MAALPLSAPAQTYRFDASLFRAGAISAQALARFNQPDAVPPGEYALDVSVNGRFIARLDVRFVADADGASAYPCLNRELWVRFGVQEKYINTDAAHCALPAQQVAGATWQLDLAKLRLTITVPQSRMTRVARGAVNPADLHTGAPIAFVNYTGNAHHVAWQGAGRGAGQDSGFLGATGGFNVGPWQYRQQGSVSFARGTRPKWVSLRSYVQRPVPALGSQLTLGQTSTSGRFFSALNYTGLALATDVRMRPDSQRGYAPTVRGVAQTNARVSVRQNGQEIYQTSVPPGPFVIDDLYPTAYNGDLHVEVLEADGSSHTFSLPFAAVPQSLRPGNLRYQLALGRTRNRAGGNSYFSDFTLERGFTNSVTANAGLRVADRYLAFVGGGVYASRLGAFGLNLTYTRAGLPGAGVLDGWMASLAYSRSFAPTGTNVSLAGYRYSTRGYRELADVLGVRHASRQGLRWQSSSYRQKTRLEASVSQTITWAGRDYGSVFVSASTQAYRDGRQPDHQLQLGYNTAWANGVSLNLSLARQYRGKSGSGGKHASPADPADKSPQSAKYDQVIMVSLAVPLGPVARPSGSTAGSSLTSHLTGNLSYGYTHSEARGGQHQTSVSGTLDAAQSLSYSLGASHRNASPHAARQTTWNASLARRFAAARVNVSASGGRQYWQAAANVQGALALHAGGVTFGPYLGETFALVEAPGAAGARLVNAQGARIDARGYALVPALTPYRYNTILLDPQGMRADVELEDGEARIAPVAGASVKVVFRTRGGQALLIRARHEDGTALPLGADVLDATGEPVGMVGQQGLAYVRVSQPRGELRLAWGKRPDERCRLPYDSSRVRPQTQTGTPTLIRLEATCHPETYSETYPEAPAPAIK